VRDTLRKLAAEFSNIAFDTLHRAGWSIGEVGGANGWYVYGHRGEQVIDAAGQTSAEAWQAVLEQAESMPTAIVETAP
jgi:hypothetical protein